MNSGNLLIGALAEIAVKFNNFSAQDIDLDYITDKAREISGAKYAVLNQFDKRKLTATTLAYAGISGHLKKATSLFGFDFVGKNWAVEPKLLKEMTDNPIIVHDHLFELAKTNLPETFIKLLVNIFKLGKVATVATNCDEEILGNFHLLFAGEDEIKSKELLRLYASMTGNLLKRIDSERKLLEEYQKMEVITTNSPNLLLMVDQNLNVHYINKVLQGFDWEKLIGNDLLNYLFQQHLQEYPGWLKEVISTRITLEKEVKVVGQFGEEAIYHVSFIPVTQQGKAARVFIMAADVTQSKQTEARLKLITGTINEVFYLYNITEQKYDFISPNCAEILGVSQQFFYLGNRYNKQVVHEADKEILLKANKDIIGGIPYDIEYRIWVKEAIRWINEKSFPIKDNAGNTVKHTGLFADITERKTIELQLRQNFSFQKTIAEISEQLVQTSSETLNHTINEMLRKLGNHFKVDRSYLFLYAQDGTTISNTHEWCNAGIEAQKENVQNYAVNPHIWWKKELDAGKYLHIPNVLALSDEKNPEKKIFQAQGIQSLLFLPVRTHNKSWGFIGLDAVKSKYCWSENEIENLQIAANTLAGLLQKLESRRQLLDITRAVDESSQVSMTDSNGTIVKVNKHFCEISGYSEAELLGQNHRIINSGYHDKAFFRDLWKTITAGKIWKGEIRNRAKDGSEYWVSTVINPIVDETGKITHYLSIRQDITDRKKVELELLLSRERWQLAIDGTNDGMWDWNIQTGDVYFSPRWEEMFGFKTGEVPQRIDSMNPVVHPDDAADMYERVNQYLRREIPSYSNEFRMVHKDGKILWTLHRASAIWDKTGMPLRMIGTTIDISERKAKDRELLEANRKFDDILAKVGDVIWSVSMPDYKMLFVSPSIESITTYTVEECMEDSSIWQRVIHPDDVNIVDVIFNKLNEKGSSEAEYRIVTKTGEIKWLLNKSKVIFDKNQERVRLDGVLIDITQRKQAEQQQLESQRQTQAKSRLLDALATFNTYLLQEADWVLALSKGIEVIGKALECERVYFYENVSAEHNPIFITQRVEWVGNNNLHNKNFDTEHVPLNKFEEFEAILLQNKTYSGVVANLPEGAVRRACLEQGVQALIVTPIFINNDFYGLIGFDFHSPKFNLSQDELSVANTVAFNLSTSIQRKQAEQALLESETKLRSILDSMEESNILIGADFKVLSFNRVIQENIRKNYNRQFGIGDDFRQYIAPGTEEDFYKSFETALGGETVRKEMPFAFDNKEYYYSFVYYPVYDRNNHIIGVSFNISDITQSKLAMRSLKESEANLKEAHGIAKLGRWDLDLIKNQLNWSDSVFEIFEIDKEKFISTYEGFLNIIHPDDFSLVNEAYTRSLETKKPFEIEHRIQMKDGRIKWLLEKCRTDYDAEGRALRSMGVVQDITERKNYEENLRKANERFEKIVEATNDAIWDWDIPNNTLFLGGGFNALFGYEVKTITTSFGQWSEHIHPEDTERVISTIHQCIDSGRTHVSIEYRYKKSDGIYTYVIQKGVVIRDTTGKAIQMVGAISDNPERIRHEEELVAINTTLEKHVKHIEEQNTKLRNIAWTQSHEVRAPLARILGIVNLIEAEQGDLENLSFWLNQLRVSSDEMDEIIKKISKETHEVQN